MYAYMENRIDSNIMLPYVNRIPVLNIQNCSKFCRTHKFDRTCKLNINVRFEVFTGRLSGLVVRVPVCLSASGLPEALGSIPGATRFSE
jgi:hypothetical protein